jgi:hypothetical protein
MERAGSGICLLHEVEKGDHEQSEWWMRNRSEV